MTQDADKPTQDRLIELEECAEHVTTSSCWIGLFGKVYDVTSFLDDHPGGDDVIIDHAGERGMEPRGRA